MFATLVTGDAERLGPTYLPIAVALFALRGLLHGVSQGGGSLAWNLGHLHFAKADEAEVYMGIHVFLAGVRGLIAPLAGMWLWTVIGWPVWLIALALALSGLAVYASLARLEVGSSTRHHSIAVASSPVKSGAPWRRLWQTQYQSRSYTPSRTHRVNVDHGQAWGHVA
jgi:hypothetical protein